MFVAYIICEYPIKITFDLDLQLYHIPHIHSSAIFNLLWLWKTSTVLRNIISFFILFSIFISSFCPPLYLAFKTNSFEMSTTDIKYRNAHLVYNIITDIMVMFIEVYYNFIFFLDFIWIFFHFDYFFFKIPSYENGAQDIWKPNLKVHMDIWEPYLSARLMTLPVICIAHLSAGFFSLPVFSITHFSNALPVKW